MWRHSRLQFSVLAYYAGSVWDLTKVRLGLAQLNGVMTMLINTAGMLLDGTCSGLG